MAKSHKHEPDWGKGLLAGLAGGLAGAAAMSAAQQMMSAARHVAEQQAEQRRRAQRGQQPGGHIRRDIGDAHPADRPHHLPEGASSGGESAGSSDDDAPATVKAAQMLSQRVFGHELTDREKRIAGPAVHYGFGTLCGAAYGVAAEYIPHVTDGFGTAFGTGLMVVSDETAVPAMGLSNPPHKHKPSTHAYSLVAHLVFGVVCEAVRRLVRRWLG